MGSPSKTDFFDAAQWVYRDDPTLPEDLTQFQTPAGLAITGSVRKDGFFGAAFETASGQIIVSFEGTDLGGLQSDPGFVQPQIAADVAIYKGENPPLYADALRFTRRVLRAAARQGISRSDVFVDGHSLGGAEAEYVAAKTGLGGRTFGAPGIPSSDISADRPSTLVNYVDYGDPIGNYSANPPVDGNFLASDTIERFGSATYVGDPASLGALGVAGALYGTSPLGNLAALGMLSDAVSAHHLLQDYAADLDITPAGSAPDWMSNLNASQLDQVIAEIAIGQGGSGGALGGLGALLQGGSLTDEIAGLAQAIGGGHAAGVLGSLLGAVQPLSVADAAGPALHPNHPFKLAG